MIKILDFKKEKNKIFAYFNKRNIFDFIQPDYYKTVTDIINDVKKNGDKSLLKYAKKFDNVELKKLKISKQEIDISFNKIKNQDTEFIKSFGLAIDNIKKFHSLYYKKSFLNIDENNVMLGEIVRPVEKAGIYVPAASAPLVSTLAMNVIPAQIAGVKELCVITPPEKTGKVNDYILATAKMLDIDNIYISGGAQAIAALAFGTETIPKVDKITGPGNIFVALAKKIVCGVVDIDMIAGPSELVIVADNNVNDEYICADLMSQSEHGSGMETSIAILFSKTKANNIIKKLDNLINIAERKKEILNAFKKYGMIIIVRNMNEAIELINRIAPEHLELLLENPEIYLKDIRNAGAIFLGQYTPEAVGDYIAGPNHTLPTTSTARFYSPLSVNSFLKSTNVLKYTEQALREIGKDVIKIAEVETLYAHSLSIKKRLEKN